MATCGPSNAMQSMKSHITRDSTLQREQVSSANAGRQRAFGSSGPGNVEAQFSAFNTHSAAGFGNDLYSGPPVPGHALADHASLAGLKRASASPPALPNVGYMGRAPALTHDPQNHGPRQSADWINEFQNLSINDPSHEQRHGAYSHPQSSYPQNTYSPAFGPNLGQGHLNRGQFGQDPFIQGQFGQAQFGPAPGQFGQEFGMGLQAAAGPQDPAFSDAFADAFAEAEASLKKLQAAEVAPAEPELKEEPAQAGASLDDASAVASDIINTISERQDAELAQKVQGSKFMTLMSKLKSNEVKLDSKEFVAAADNTVVDTSAIQADPEALANDMSAASKMSSAHDWAPQRPVNQTLSAREQPPLTQEEAPRKYRFSRDLDDPDTYLLKLRKSLDPRLFEKSPYDSPFSAAQELAPQALHSGSWEEQYNDW